MTSASPVPAILAAIDRRPGDFTDYGALADYYDEVGDVVTAEGWRWAAAKRRVPVVGVEDGDTLIARYFGKWTWFGDRFRWPSYYNTAKLPHDFALYIFDKTKCLTTTAVDTPSMALIKVVDVWSMQSEARRNRFWDWTPPEAT